MSERSETTSPVILGLGGSGHEWSTCAVRGEELVAVAEERVTRKKYGLGADLLAAESRRACLEAFSASAKDVEKIVVCDLVPRPFYFPFRQLAEKINHHLAHAHCAFATSGVERAAILVVDNSGSVLEGDKTGAVREVETASIFDAGPDGIKLLMRITGEHHLQAATETEFYQAGQTSNSLGYFFRSASLALGFSFQNPKGPGIFSEDGKTMGLSPYGDDRYIDQVGELIDLSAKGGLKCDHRAIDVFMEGSFKRGRFDERAALAYAVQHHLERAMVHLARHAYDLTGHDCLCVAGGVALNSVANGKLVSDTPFHHIYVPSAPSDDGIGLGCAAYGIWQKTGKRPVFPRSAYLGPPHAKGETERAVAASGLEAIRPNDMIEAVAEELCKGKVVAWYQGRSEFGPRALGNRSILAMPTPGWVRDKLNHEMKRREWFRPYAPIVPEERKDEYFEFANDSPHMSFVAPVRKPGDLPAATHVDGTARLQTIRRTENPMIHALLETVGRKSGTPILLNTSFNCAGDPIVETPMDAIESAKKMSLDYLVLGDHILTL